MKYRKSTKRHVAHNVAPLLTALFCLTACQGYVEGGSVDPDDSADAGTDEPSKPTPRAGSSAPKPPKEDEEDPPPDDKPVDPPEDDPPTMVEPPADDDPVLVCNTAPERAEATLTTFCSGCHGGDVA